MRQRQQLFLSINRIAMLLYVPLSIVLAVFYLFTGNLIDTALAMCTLIWIFLPSIIHRIFHLRRAHLLVTLYLFFILTAYSGGLVLTLGNYIPFYDPLVHLFGGFFLSILASVIFCLFINHRTVEQHLYFFHLFCFCFSLSFGSLWQLMQIAIVAGIMKNALFTSDIIWNLAACLMGTFIYCLLTTLHIYRGIHTYPLYALEDFTTLNIKPADEAVM